MIVRYWTVVQHQTLTIRKQSHRAMGLEGHYPRVIVTSFQLLAGWSMTYRTSGCSMMRRPRDQPVHPAEGDGNSCRTGCANNPIWRSGGGATELPRGTRHPVGRIGIQSLARPLGAAAGRLRNHHPIG